MKNLELRASLIKSGIIIALFIFIIYAFAVGDSGGITGTIGSLISAFTFVIGLVLALLISVIVIFGVYFGILYLYDPEVSKTVFGEFLESLSKISKHFSCCSTGSPTKPEKLAPTLTVDDLQPLQTDQNKLAALITATNASVDALQKSVTNLQGAINSANEELSALNEKTNTIEEDLQGKASTDAIVESAKKTDATINSSIKPLIDKITNLEDIVAGLATANDEDTGDDVQEKIDHAVSTLKKELTAVKKSVASLEPDTDTTDDSRHRILDYFDNKKDENKFVKLVKEKVTPDMTYAQVDEFLVESLSKEAAAIISDHPSLTKDFIRSYRKKD